MTKRFLLAGLIATIATLQAWDSGVLGAGGVVIALVVSGIGALATAVLLSGARRLGVLALAVGMILIVTARVVSPVSLNELFIIFPITVVPFLFEQIQQQRKRREC